VFGAAVSISGRGGIIPIALPTTFDVCTGTTIGTVNVNVRGTV